MNNKSVITFLILVFTFFLQSCDTAEEKKEKERIKTEFNLIEGRIPDILIQETRIYNGFCQETDNPNKFEFKEEAEWIWLWRDDLDTNRTRYNHPKFWDFGDYPEDRYDRSLPPNFCEIDYSREPYLDLTQKNKFKAKAICSREIYDSFYDEKYIEKRFDAKCDFEITKRHSCLPDYYFDINDKRHIRDSGWRKAHKYEACSSDNLQDYKNQVIERWRELKDN